MKPTVSTDLHREIEHFLFWESSLLEDNRFEEWLQCLSEDVRYWMPVRECVEVRDGQPPAREDVFVIFDDDKKSLELRVLRIRTGQAHAEVPASVTQRYITNVMVTEQAGEGATSYAVRANIKVYQERRGLHAVHFYGRRDDVLRRKTDGTFEIADRKIELAQAILPTTLSIFL